MPRYLSNKTLSRIFASACGVFIPLSTQAIELDGCRKVQTGLASWYGEELRGSMMANGQRFNPDLMTIAHKTLPLGTPVKIQFGNHVAKGVVADHGPNIKGRIVDASKKMAETLGLIEAGVGEITLFRCDLRT